jgi:archaellum component FlaC
VEETNKSMSNISKQVKRQANSIDKLEKAIVSLQKPISKIDKQSNIIKQLYGAVTQIQRQVRSSKNPKIKQVSQKNKVSKKESH